MQQTLEYISSVTQYLLQLPENDFYVHLYFILLSLVVQAHTRILELLIFNVPVIKQVLYFDLHMDPGTQL